MEIRNISKIKDEKLTFNNINQHIDIILKLSEMEKYANENIEYCNDKRKLHMIKDEKLTLKNMQKLSELQYEVLNGNIISDDYIDISNATMTSEIYVLEN